MTEENFKREIQFREEETIEHHIIRAAITFRDVYYIDRLAVGQNQLAMVRSDAMDTLAHSLLRQVYEDRRREVRILLYDLMKLEPYQYPKQVETIDQILKLLKFQ